MQVIAFASQKGGSGKTTLAGHVAVEAERAGAGRVALVDADPQGSLAAWWNEREAATPVFMSTTVERLAENMSKLRSLGIDLLVIDIRNARSSTTVAMRGNTSLTHRPHSPCRPNSNGEPSTLNPGEFVTDSTLAPPPGSNLWP